ncbi:MAG: tRNA uridine-5-carboxymethylaminomethyl(34) synthesis GTPase MnmE, partial [Aquificota bacterium]
ENIFSILVDSIEGIIHFDEKELTSDITTIEGMRKDFLKGVTSDGTIILNAKNIIEDLIENIDYYDFQREILMLHIREAENYLEEITGEISTEDILGSIFSKFCIGK